MSVEREQLARAELAAAKDTCRHPHVGAQFIVPVREGVINHAPTIRRDAIPTAPDKSALDKIIGEGKKFIAEVEDILQEDAY